MTRCGMALILSRNGVRGLLMVYAGLPLGEACVVTAKVRRGVTLRQRRPEPPLLMVFDQASCEASRFPVLYIRADPATAPIDVPTELHTTCIRFRCQCASFNLSRV